MSPSAEQSASVVRRRYHTSAGSVLYVLTTIFLAIGAINSQNNLLFFAFGIAAGAMVISGFVSGPALMRVRARRDVPATAEVGRPFVVRYTVWNLSRLWPAFGLAIVEEKLSDKAAGPLGDVASCVQHVGTRQTVRATSSITPRSRGLATLDRFTMSTTFPLGLARKSVTFGLPSTMIVRPRQLRLRAGLLDRLAGGVSRLTSARNALGQGDEIYGLRAYAPGDAIRSIAWRASARAGTPVVRQTTMPAPARLWIEFRPSIAILDPHDQEIAISLAASCARMADSHGFAVGVVGFGSTMLPRPGRRHIERVLDFLARLRVDAETPPESRGTVTRRDGSVVIAATPEPIGPGSIVLAVSQAHTYLAPGQELPVRSPPPIGRLRRAVGEFLGLEEPGS